MCTTTAGRMTILQLMNSFVAGPLSAIKECMLNICIFFSWFGMSMITFFHHRLEDNERKFLKN
jgi:hypothetical protein